MPPLQESWEAGIESELDDDEPYEATVGRGVPNRKSARPLTRTSSSSWTRAPSFNSDVDAPASPAAQSPAQVPSKAPQRTSKSSFTQDDSLFSSSTLQPSPALSPRRPSSRQSHAAANPTTQASEQRNRAASPMSSSGGTSQLLGSSLSPPGPPGLSPAAAPTAPPAAAPSPVAVGVPPPLPPGSPLAAPSPPPAAPLGASPRSSLAGQVPLHSSGLDSGYTSPSPAPAPRPPTTDAVAASPARSAPPSPPSHNSSRTPPQARMPQPPHPPTAPQAPPLAAPDGLPLPSPLPPPPHTQQRRPPLPLPLSPSPADSWQSGSLHLPPGPHQVDSPRLPAADQPRAVYSPPGLGTRPPKAPPTPPQGVTAAEVQAAGLSQQDQGSGLRLPTPLQLFVVYDRDGSNGIGEAEFKQMLFDLDGLKGVPQHSVDLAVARAFEQADLNHDQVVSIDEFYLFYYSQLCFKFPLLPGINPGADMFTLFNKISSRGGGPRFRGMTREAFLKAVRSWGITSSQRRLTLADVDLVFYRARAETQLIEGQSPPCGSACACSCACKFMTHGLTYSQFMFALMLVAEKLQAGFQLVVDRVLHSSRALLPPSQADFLVMNFTGSPADFKEFVERPRGLPRLPAQPTDLPQRLQSEAALALRLRMSRTHSAVTPGRSKDEGGDNDVDADDADEAIEKGELPEIVEYLTTAAERKAWGLEDFGSAQQLGLPCTGLQALTDPAARVAVRLNGSEQLRMGLQAGFERYCQWNGGTDKSAMDKTRFVKWMRDARLVSEAGPPAGLPSAAVDGIYRRALQQGQRALNFLLFLEALRLVATALRLSLNEVAEQLVLVHAPLSA